MAQKTLTFTKFTKFDVPLTKFVRGGGPGYTEYYQGSVGLIISATVWMLETTFGFGATGSTEI